MLDSIASSLITWFSGFQSNRHLEPLNLLLWERSAIFQLPPQQSDRPTILAIEAYLQKLNGSGIDLERQGIWIQSDRMNPIENRGKTPLPAASLTKIATTLASLEKFGAKHQFVTNIYVLGEISNGIVEGDLIVEGSGDPFFVWEEAIAIGNTLERLGISKINGNLLVTDRFYMNYQDRALQAGELLKQGLNRQLWQGEITGQYSQMPVGTKQPEVAIAGSVKLTDKIPSDARLLVAHQSLPLTEILRQMNIYSNNKMAQILADLVGGAAAVARISVETASFSPTEIELINGSGLGEENQISPHAVCQMLMAIDRLLQPHSLSAADLFPTAGRDFVGTLQGRGLPTGTTIKTGTLNNVSALAGVVSSNRGNVYFSIINYGSQIDYFRQQQDILLNQLVQTWQPVANDFNLAGKKDWYLGDPQRNYFNLNN